MLSTAPPPTRTAKGSAGLRGAPPRLLCAAGGGLLRRLRRLRRWATLPLGRRPKSHELSGATAQGEGGGTEVWLDIGKCLGVAVMLWWSCAVTFLSVWTWQQATVQRGSIVFEP